jgi:hypothetical protein
MTGYALLGQRETKVLYTAGPPIIHTIYISDISYVKTLIELHTSIHTDLTASIY